MFIYQKRHNKFVINRRTRDCAAPKKVRPMETAVIIAGGEGSRLFPLTKGRPKTLVEVAGKPMLQWIIEWLKEYGVNHIVIGVAYKKEKIYEFMEKNNNFGLRVDFSEHTLEGGTAEGFGRAIGRFVKDEDFIAMNSDELFNMDLGRLTKEHRDRHSIVTMSLAPLHVRFSVAELEKENVTGFTYGKKMPDIPVSNGLYVFNRDIIKHIPETGSIEDLVFTKLAKDGKIVGIIMGDEEDWISVNTIKDIREAEHKLIEWGRVKKTSK